MLKALIIIILFCTPFLSFSQSLDKNKEMAYYAVNHQGATAYTSTIKSMRTTFTDQDLATLSEIMAEKEGIFELVLTEESYIAVSHLAGISKETLKAFLIMVKDDIEFIGIKEYNF